MAARPSPPAPTASLTDRQILLIGINYWPEETGNAPYTTGLAEHLVARGARVTVLTGMPYYPEWGIRDGYRGRWRMRERVGGVELRRYRQYVPHQQSALRRSLFEASFLANGLLTVGLPRPDAIVGIVPSLSGGLLAALAARRYRAPFGLMFQDLVGQSAAQSGIAGGGKVARLTSLLEGWIARRASAVSIVAEGFRPYLEHLGVDPGCVRRVRNWTHIGWPRAARDETRTRLGIPAEAFVCLHSGNMGLKQGLENVIACADLARASQPDWLFVLVGDGNQRTHLERLAAGLPNVRFFPPQPERLFPDVLAAADVLLVNQRPSVTDMSLPGKLTSYFAAGRPVVAAVAPASEAALEIRSAGAGLVVDAGSPEKLLSGIRVLADDPLHATKLGQRGKSYAAAHLSAEAALRHLEGFVLDITQVTALAERSGRRTPQLE